MQSGYNHFTLVEWLDYLENSHSVEIQLGLTRVARVAADLGLLKPACPVILVAGTNGKGSTVTALETIYHSAGYQVGAYTSPHLHHFNERIRVNRQPITDTDLCNAFSSIEKGRRETPLTYFEVATLSALWYFNDQKLDVMILEVGLGGRLDATNIIDAAVSVITTIAFDHEAWLGSTLEAIGFEKAGIMRPGKPCIYADINPPASIEKQAVSQQVPLFCLEKDYQIKIFDETFELVCQQKTWNLPKPAIQVKSAAAAIIAIDQLQTILPVTHDSMHKALQKVFIPGRLELSSGSIRVLYDVAHNPQAAELLAKTIKAMSVNRIHVIFSALMDKNLSGLIHPLRDCVDHWYPAQLNSKRASTQAMLDSVFDDLQIPTEGWYAHPQSAFTAAKSRAEAGDLIVVYGSFLTVAAVREKETL